MLKSIMFATVKSETYKPTMGNQPTVTEVAGWVLVLLRRRWPTLIIGTVVSATLFVLLPQKYATRSYEARASLLHTNLPIPESQKVYYQAPEIKTVMALFTDRDTLNQLRELEQIQVPVKLLERSISTELANGTKNMKVNFTWANDKDAVRMLGETIKIVSETLDQVRVDKLGNYVKELKGELAERGGWLKDAMVKLDEYKTRNHITDLELDLERIHHEIVEKKIQLESIERNGLDIKAQQDRLAQYMSEIKKREEADAVVSSQFEAANETVSDNRRRQDRLRELIFEERRVQEVQSRISAKQGEFNRLDALRKKGFTSPHEIEAILGELKSLQAQIKTSDKIGEWEKELERIDKVVVPKNAKKNVGSPIIQQTLFRELELTLSKLANEVQARVIKESIALKISEKNRLITLRVENEDIKSKVESAQAAERAVSEKIQILSSLIRLSNAEIVVIAEPQIAPEGTKSNRKLMMLAGAFAGIVPTCALLIVLEGIHLVRARSKRQLISSLPVIGHYECSQVKRRRYSSTPSVDARLLALKIRKLKPNFGTVIAFAGVDKHSKGLSPLITELAISLARRDERVLILNTRGIDHHRTSEIEPAIAPQKADSSKAIHVSGHVPGKDKSSTPKVTNTQLNTLQSSVFNINNTAANSVILDNDSMPDDQELPGLSDYLGFLRTTVDEIKTPGPGYGIDVIPPGRMRLHAEALASHRMREVIQEIRKEYSIIIILTSGLADPVAMHTMMEHVDATIVVANQDVPAPAAMETLNTLQEEGEEIIGQIVFDQNPAHRRQRVKNGKHGHHARHAHD